MDLQTAVDKLNSQLPLKQRQSKLSQQLKAVHQGMLHAMIEQGRPLSRDEVAQLIENESVDACLQKLSTEDLIVLNNNKPVGAYPVTLENTPHKVTVNGHKIHAMCALDAVSVAPMFETEVLIESSWRSTETPILIHMQSSKILETLPTDEVTVGIHWQMPSDVAAHSMCMEMVFLKDHQTAKSWLETDTDNTSLFTLPEAVEFGSRFFLPLLR